MASPGILTLDHSMNDNESDYGSDFSPEEEQIVASLLLSAQQPTEDDNPIVNEIEHHDPQRTLRLPRILGREERSPLFQAARAAEAIADQISRSVASSKYPDCEYTILPVYALFNLTDAKAVSG